MKSTTRLIAWLLTCPLTFAQDPAPIAETAAGLRAAAESGDPAAVYRYARACATGRGAPKDVNKAFEWMKKAAGLGNADAIGGMGVFYAKGIVVPKDGHLALDWFRKGAENGSASSQLNLARCLLGEETLEGVTLPPYPAHLTARKAEGLEWLRKAAAQQLPDAAAGLGRCYYFGEHDVAQDYKEAERWLLVSAEAGDASSQNLLGVIYDQAQLGSRDEEKALAWFTKAALQGNLKAQASLGRVLGPRSEIRGRRIDSIAWLIVAAESGEITAKKYLETEKPGINNEDYSEATTRARQLRLDISRNRSPFASLGTR
jgi:TPR repeat protein